MTPLKLALDWTPNVNHIGFLIAKELGFYAEQGLDVYIIDPSEDNYALTPGKKLEQDMADFAIAPFETVISLNNKPNKVTAQAIFAILQEDLSCIVALAESGISRPKDMEGKSYASYKARYEDHIVRQMMINDGGSGNLNISYPSKLGIWNVLLQGKADTTWIFDNWEGVEASGKGVELHKFRLKDYGIPYGYSPVVLAKKEKIEANKEDYSRFIAASKKGFLQAKEDLSTAEGILTKYATAYDLENIDMREAIKQTLPYFGNASDCGTMKPERIQAFLQWVVHHGIEDHLILEQKLFTNEIGIGL